MDAFYASVEQRDCPAYRGKPVVVGGRPEKRGVVAAASYEARAFGIHSAMSSRRALQRCPHLIFARPRFEVYRAISQQIRAIFLQYTDLVEPLALDEAYLDVTENKLNSPSAIAIARAIKQQILTETGLTASAGVSINKFLAKLASGANKPDGLTAILPDRVDDFLANLPIEKFHGIGRVTAAKMRSRGIFSGADLKRQSLESLTKHFGKMGQFYYRIVRGEDDRPVKPNRDRKSIGTETTFVEDLLDLATIHQELADLARSLKQRIDRHGAQGRTLTLKVKYGNFQQITRSQTLLVPLHNDKAILNTAQTLLTKTEVGQRPIRLLGLSLSNLVSEKVENSAKVSTYEQLSLPL